MGSWMRSAAVSRGSQMPALEVRSLVGAREVSPGCSVPLRYGSSFRVPHKISSPSPRGAAVAKQESQ